MLARAFMVLAYYVVAFAALAAWVFRDFEAAKRRVQAGGRGASDEAGRFVDRASIVLGLLGGGGAAIAFGVLLTPTPSVLVIAGAGLATFVVAALLLEAFLRLAPRVLHADPLAELRPAALLGHTEVTSKPGPAPDEPEPPCLD